MRLTDAEIKDLLKELRAGDLEARDKIIISHRPLALFLANKYAARNPNDRDDLISIAYMAVVHNVDRIMHGKALKGADNIGGFLNSHIVFAIRDFYKNREPGEQPVQTSYNEGIARLKIDELLSICRTNIEREVAEDLIAGKRL